MRSVGRLGILLLACVLMTGCPSSEERAEQASADARQALARGDHAAAIAAVEVLRENAADTPENLIELSELLVTLGEAPQVLWLLQEGVRKFPDRVDLRLGLARIALMLGNSGAAVAALEPIGPDAEDHAVALLYLGQAELSRGDLGRALERFVAAEELYPERPEAILARISALMGERRLDEARPALAEAISRFAGGETENALRQVRIAFYSLEAEAGKLDVARAALRELVDEAPGDTGAWQALVNVMWAEREFEAAVALLEAAIAEDEERLQLYSVLIPLLQAVGRDDEAERLLVDRVERSPSPTGYAALARFHLTHEQAPKALAMFDEAHAAYPGNAILERLHVETWLLQGELEKARIRVEIYASEHPDDPSAEYLQARIELADGDAAAAKDRLTRVMPLIDESTTQYWLGKALQANGEYQAAERRFGLALARQNRDPALYVPLLELGARRGDWQSVFATAFQLTKLAPGVFEGWEAALVGLLNLGDGVRAVPLAEHAAKLFPDAPEAQLLLARAHRAAGENDTALETLRATRERFGGSAELAAEEAMTLGISGRVAEGVTVAQAGLAEHPDSAKLYTAVASLLFAAGQAEQGGLAVDRALALEPDNLQPLRIRAQFRAATRDLPGAIGDAERYLAQRPDDPTVRHILAVVLQHSGRIDDAIAAYRRAAELDRNAFEARNNLAFLLTDRDLPAALEAAQEAYALAPQNPSVLDTLGSLYLKKGLVERATRLLEEAHKRLPQEGEVQLHLALAYRDGGRADDARRLLTALESRDGSPATLLAQVSEALRSLQ